MKFAIFAGAYLIAYAINPDLISTLSATLIVVATLLLAGDLIAWFVKLG